MTLGLASLAGSAIAGVFADRMLRDGFGATFLVLAIATVGLLTLNTAYVAILVFAATWGICRIRRAWPTRVRCLGLDLRRRRHRAQIAAQRQVQAGYRFATFVNVPELIAKFRTFADMVIPEDLRDYRYATSTGAETEIELPVTTTPLGAIAKLEHVLPTSRRCHILVDTLGLPIANRVEAADISDRRAGALLTGGLKSDFPSDLDRHR